MPALFQPTVGPKERLVGPGHHVRRPHDDGAIAGRAGVRLGTARDVTNGEVSSPRTGLGTWHRGQTLHPQWDMPSAVGTLRASPGHETDSSPLLSAATPAPPRRFRPWTVDHTARSMGIDCSGPEPTRGLSHRTIPATHARPRPAPSNSSSPVPPAQLPQRNLPPPENTGPGSRVQQLPGPVASPGALSSAPRAHTCSQHMEWDSDEAHLLHGVLLLQELSSRSVDLGAGEVVNLQALDDLPLAVLADGREGGDDALGHTIGAVGHD